MTQSARKPNARSLGFESLETRQSLTTVSGALLDPALSESNAAEVAQDTASPSTSKTSSSYSASNLLLYVATLEQVSIDRSTPSQAEAVAIDQLIVEGSPLSFG